MTQVPANGAAFELDVSLASGDVTRCRKLENGVQPLISPDECFLAESIVKTDEKVISLLKDRYGVEDLNLLACDPWSVHVVSGDIAPLHWRQDGIAPRLVQTFLYLRHDPDDNQYAHPVRCEIPWSSSLYYCIV